MNYLIILSLKAAFLQSLSCFEMTLLHVNDIHVKIEETNKYSSTCKPADKEAGKCYGGVARLTLVNILHKIFFSVDTKHFPFV